MSLKNENTTIRLLIYILVFLILILLILLFFIIPNIKKYKTSEVELKNIESRIEDYNNSYLSLKDELKELKDENKEIISKFNRDFNKSDFIKFSTKYLQNVTIKRAKDNNNNNFTEYNFSAYTKNSSPKEFFKFIEDLKEYKNIVKIKFPILLEKKDKNIFIKFVLAIYKSGDN